MSLLGLRAVFPTHPNGAPNTIPLHSVAHGSWFGSHNPDEFGLVGVCDESGYFQLTDLNSNSKITYELVIDELNPRTRKMEPSPIHPSWYKFEHIPKYPQQIMILLSGTNHLLQTQLDFFFDHENMNRLTPSSYITPSPVRQVAQHDDVITCFSVSPECAMFATGCRDGSFSVWLMTDANHTRSQNNSMEMLLHIPNAHHSIHKSQRLSSHSSTLSHSNSDSQSPFNTDGVTCISMLLGAVVTGGCDQLIRVFDVSSGSCIQSFDIQASLVSCLHFFRVDNEEKEKEKRRNDDEDDDDDEDDGGLEILACGTSEGMMITSINQSSNLFLLYDYYMS